ncbi:MAG: nucleoside triphosphate pyrophosphohydrolase [Ignavibacteria bacterium]|nr:nucleoside triphosphate pyrophosphohydrolase [Ignavibacteria bacterium]
MEKDKIEVPKPKNPESLCDQFLNFVEIVKLLRIHCPWDRKQTNESIAPLLIEEAYETISAIENRNDRDFLEELGDLFLHIVMHSVMAEERGAFNLVDVLKKIQEKLVFRHPHVFSSTEVNGEEEVLKNWEELKQKEGKSSVLEGVPINLPSLLRAERIQYKASRVGFDWEKREDVMAKVLEEFEELKIAIENEENLDKVEEEFGDLLFALVNYARFLGISPEIALQKTNNKFIRRFQTIEDYAKRNNKNLSEMTLSEMDAIWNRTKSSER